MKTVYILGAGVDRPLGLPLADGLLRELGAFAKGDGKNICQAIKDKLGGGRRVRFSFDKYVSNQGENFAERLLSDPGLGASLEAALAKAGTEVTDGGTAVQSLINKLKVIREANEIDEETAKALASIGGESEEMADYTVLRTRGLVLNPAPRNAMLRILRDTQSAEGLNDQEKEALGSVVAALTNFEDLLTELFAGFYTGKATDIRSYLYVAWVLWAYMRWKSLTVDPENDGGFYIHLSDLSEDDQIITFNYTSLGNLPPERTIRFHGDCLSYIRHDRGELILGDEAVTAAQDLDALKAFIEALDMNVDERRIFLPAIVPPSAMKPLINRDFSKRWNEAETLISHADLLVVVGYSFNRVDSHFNDLFRSGAVGKRIAVINPDLDGTRNSVCSLLGMDPSTLTQVVLDGINVHRSDQLILVPVGSQAVSPELLQRLRNGW